jgi:heterodisulfide reductase subunit D
MQEATPIEEPKRRKIHVPTMAELAAEGKEPDILFWVGCAGAFDDRYLAVTKAFVKILDSIGYSYGVLGQEESCTGDPAKRAGNEFLFQMQATQNIEIMNGYGVKKIVTACPHCYNTFKNEYPALGGNYEVVHHSTFLGQLINSGRIRVTNTRKFVGKKITYHDSCYLGRANDVYEAPRDVIRALKREIFEMNMSRDKGLCCGAGGAQMFKDAEPGDKEVNIARTEQALETGANVIATACPFCLTMMSDGVKHFEKEDKIEVYDIAELIASAKDLD